MPASVWSGYLTFGLISMPVRLFSGARGESISFNMLHREDLSRVKQQLICSTDNQVLDQIERGTVIRFQGGTLQADGLRCASDTAIAWV